MAQFLKFKFLSAIKLNFNGVNFIKQMSKFGYFKKWKKFIKLLSMKLKILCICVVKSEVENFEHLCSNMRVNLEKDWYRPVSKLNLYLLRANVYSNLACAPF